MQRRQDGSVCDLETAVVADYFYPIANPKYFAGGDCVNGGREVVDAVADGKRSALALARQLESAHA